jgi:endoribonuclease Dicer
MQFRDCCKRLPEDRLLKGNDYDLYAGIGEDEIQRVYSIKSSGARLTQDSSLGVLAYFVASLVSSGLIESADIDILQASGH